MSDLAAKLSIGCDTVKEYLRRLKVKGLLVREGTVKAGSWLLTPAGKAAAVEDE
jgi:Mn-dependent DtxR family transcriptional regulator